MVFGDPDTFVLYVEAMVLSVASAISPKLQTATKYDTVLTCTGNQLPVNFVPTIETI